MTRNLTLTAHVNEYPPPTLQDDGYSACWSYIHGDGREYAVIGTTNGTAIYNVTDPHDVYRVGLHPRAELAVARDEVVPQLDLHRDRGHRATRRQRPGSRSCA